MCLLSGPWCQEERGAPSPPRGTPPGPDCGLWLKHLQFGKEGTSGHTRPPGRHLSRASPCLPPQEHKAEIKASMKASFLAAGAADPSMNTEDTGEAAQHRQGDARTPTGWEDRTQSWDPTPSWPAVLPAVLGSPQKTRPGQAPGFQRVPERQCVRSSQEAGPQLCLGHRDLCGGSGRGRAGDHVRDTGSPCRCSTYPAAPV